MLKPLLFGTSTEIEDKVPTWAKCIFSFIGTIFIAGVGQNHAYIRAENKGPKLNHFPLL